MAELVGEVAPTRILRLGTADRFGQSGTPEALLEEYGLTSRHIGEAVAKLL